MSTEWLLWIAIPLVAAAIGYVTNRVAIWMLFRPHAERRLFGVRIPFTPGLIPHRRLEMAERLGAAVAEHLITQETVSERFDSREVRAAIERIVGDTLDGWLNRELGPVETLIPPAFREEWDALLTGVKARSREEIQRILYDPRTEAWVEELVDATLEGWLNRPLGQLLPEGSLEAIPARLGSALMRTAQDEAFEARVCAWVDEKLEAALWEDVPLGAYIPPRLRETAYAKLEGLVPPLLDRLSGLLEDEGLKKRIKLHLYELADRLLSDTFREDSPWDQLKFGLMEVFVVSVEELKEKIDRTVDEAAPRLAELLREPEVRRRIHGSLTGAVDALLKKRPSEFDLPPETIEELKGKVVGAVLGAARSPDLRRHLQGLIADGLARMKDRSLGELFPQLALGSWRARTGDHLLGALRREEAVDALARFAALEVEALLSRPLGRLSDHIPEGSVAKGKRWLSEEVLRLLVREVPKVVQAINVQGLVREKVNQLSIAEVERLILVITSRQLRAIAWFGALLGFLIGLLQLAIVAARGGL